MWPDLLDMSAHLKLGSINKLKRKQGRKKEALIAIQLKHVTGLLQ